MRAALLGDDQHREHDHRDVVVPSPPARHLIVCPTALTLGMFKYALNSVALTLHLAQTQQRRINRGVGRGELDGLRRSHLAADYQLPPPRRGLLTIHSQTRR
jgi:hypothetical protein